jgi:GT2 family glycosyltransferase
MATISVVIVNFNGAHLLPDCLGSLKQQTFRDFEVIFVDNGSTDASVKIARDILPHIQVIALDSNAGFARPNNLAIAAARGDFVVLLNNDASVAPTFLEKLLHAVQDDPSIGLGAPKILNFFERNVIDSVGGLCMTRDGIGEGRGRGEIDKGQYDALIEVLVPSGCAALYRRAMLQEIGGFAEEFFAYCEDAELGLRARLAGYRAISVPGAIAYHKYSASTHAYSSQKLFLVERNRFYVLTRVYPMRLLLLSPVWTLCRYVLMVYAALSRRGRGVAVTNEGLESLASALIRGAWNGLRSIPAQWRRRASVRRTISPSAFLALLRTHRASLRHVILHE